MQLKSKAEIGDAIVVACKTVGTGVTAGPVDPTETVAICCAPYAAVYSSVNAIPIPALITLAMQLVAIIFGGGPPTIEQLQAVLQLIMSIFTT